MSLKIEEQIIFRSVGGHGCSDRKLRFKLSENEIRSAYYAYERALRREFVEDSLNEAIFAGDPDSEIGAIRRGDETITDETVSALVDAVLENYISNKDKYCMSDPYAIRDAIRCALEKMHPDWEYVHGDDED